VDVLSLEEVIFKKWLMCVGFINDKCIGPPNYV
jgi:hypothetical protein